MPPASSVSGTCGEGTTPIEPANTVQAHRPAATPSSVLRQLGG
jgi:hypothetical protein